MTQDQLINLLERYQLGTLTKEEEGLLVEELIKDEHGVQVPEALMLLLNKQDSVAVYDAHRWDPILMKTLSADHPKSTSAPGTVHKGYFLRRGFIRYAAAIIILIGIASYFFLIKNNDPAKQAVLIQPNIQHPTEDIMLTLSDGRKVFINDSSGNSISDGEILIHNNNGAVSYNTALTSDHKTTGYNMMTTPKGGQYKIVLPDGTEVWLNAASSLKYPITFSGKTREVELMGEGYFKIKENKLLPFIVRTEKMNIHVLGTEFNVNAYADEPIFAATLVNGSVKVSNQVNNIIIKPGDQVAVAGQELNVTQPDMDEVLAWREGMFQFENKNIKTIMRQLQRWYDLDVEYKGALPDAEFSGSLSRTGNAVMLLDALALTRKVHFVIDGKKITVFSGPAIK